MLPLRAPIPIVTLFLSAACQPKEGASSRTETSPSESGGVVTTGSLEFPPVECHRHGEEGVCPSGQICVFQDGGCDLVEIPQCGNLGTTGPGGTSDTTTDTTGTTDMPGTTGPADPAPEKCWDARSTYTCTPIPEHCMSAMSQQALADCIRDEYICYDPLDKRHFEDGLLTCPTYIFCWEGGDYSYDYCELDCF